jgi:hypothetical protein
VKRWTASGVVLTVLLAGACTDKSEPLGPTATLAQPTTTADPYAIPPVIDEAYVNRVLAGLDAIVGDAVRHVMRTRLLDEEVFYRLRAVSSNDDTFRLKMDGLQDDLLAGMPGYRAEPGNKTTTVVRLLSASSTCLFAEVQRDFSAVNAAGEARLSTEWVALVPIDPARDTAKHNATRWMFAYDGFRADLSAPGNPCAKLS